MRLWESPLRSTRSAAVLVAAVAALSFANSFSNDFAYDDLHIIAENSDIQSLETLPGALWRPYWPSRYGRELGLWRPLITGTYGLQWALWGNNPVGFHAVNVVAHATFTVLVLLLLSRLMPLPGAFAGALLFAVHPVHVEAVANIVGLAEILAAGFFVAACLVHGSAGARIGPGRVLAIAGLYALAFLTKESAVTLPAVLVLLDAARKELRWRDLPAYLRSRGPLFTAMAAVAVGILYARFQVLGSVARPFAPLGAEILEEIPRIWTVAGIWPHYVRLLFFPQDLVSDYAPAVVPVLFGWDPQNIVGVLLAIVFLVVALVAWRTPVVDGESITPRLLAVGILWFVFTMSPASNVIFLSGVLLAERTFYLPSVGFVLGVGWLIAHLRVQRPRVAWALVLLVVGLMGYRTYTRNPTWKDNLTVFDTLLKEHPESGRGRWVLGDMHFARNEVSEALAEYRAAIGILGSHYALVTDVAKRLVGAKRYDAAEFLLRYSWEDRPEFSTAPALLAIVYAEQERFAEAEEAAKAALAVDPDDAVTLHLLAWSLSGQERYEEAIEARLGAIRNGEGDKWRQWLWLANLQAQVGDSAAALISLDSARVRVTSAADLSPIDSLYHSILRPEPGP